MPTYNPKVIEPKWQRYWEENKTFRTPDSAATSRKYYILDMFPYPSGAGLHVGHPGGLHRHRHPGPLPADARLQRPAPDGLGRLRPARRAVRHRDRHASARDHAAEHRHVPPADQDARLQLRLGPRGRHHRSRITSSGRSGSSCSCSTPGTTREQKRGRPIAELPIPRGGPGRRAKLVDAPTRTAKRLAYQAEVPVNWCPALGTVLANEEVIDGKSERGGHPVVRMPLRQWMLRITAYAERLLDDLDLVDWPESIKEMQRNWIGRSEGAEVDFAGSAEPRDAGQADVIRVFTTRPDTLFGATYMVLAPEHPLVDADHDADAAGRGRRRTRPRRPRKSDLERTELAKKKTGVFTGAYAINPVNDEQIPIWIADYVLVSYGTGAIMAVPGHDERDFEFAEQFNLPIIRTVVSRREGWRRQGRTWANGPASSTSARSTRTACTIADGQTRRSPPGWRKAAWARGRSTTSCATGCSAGSATGASRSRSCTRSTSTAKPTGAMVGRWPSRSCRCAAGAGGLQADRQARAAAGQGRRLAVGDARRQAVPARDEHHAAVGRLVLVLPALHRPAERQSLLRPGEGEVLDAGRPVRRRGRARGAAPALLAVLAQGAVRPRPRPHAGAVPALVNQGMILGEMEFTGFQKTRPVGVGSAQDDRRVGQADATRPSSSTRTRSRSRATPSC